MTKLHIKDALFFEQLPDGGVRITKHETGLSTSPVAFEIELDKDSWASVIAGMSYYGEADYGFYRALNFHTGEPMGPTTPPNLDKLKPLTA